MIIEAVIPLLLENGASVTSKQIAEAAGIAEGTIFRAFGDKDSLIAAAVTSYLDPVALSARLRRINPAQPLRMLLGEVVLVLQQRFSGVMRMMAAAGMHGPPPNRAARQESADIIVELLADHRELLRVDARHVAQYARLVAFASAIPAFGDGLPFTIEELVDFVEYGVMIPSPIKD